MKLKSGQRWGIIYSKLHKYVFWFPFSRILIQKFAREIKVGNKWYKSRSLIKCVRKYYKGGLFGPIISTTYGYTSGNSPCPFGIKKWYTGVYKTISKPTKPKKSGPKLQIISR